MTSNTVGKILVGLAAWLFVGASMMDCASDLPLSYPGGNSGVGGKGGKGGKGGNGGNGGAAENGGNGAAGQTSIITTLPSGNADANVQDVEPVVASADANCGVQTQNPKPKQVDLLLVLDRSGSMAYDIASGSNCNVGSTTCTQRWATVTASLKQVLATTPASVQWGLKLFTSPKGSTCTVNAGADVSVGPNSAAQIQTTMASTSPANQTPTRDAINKAVAYYNTLNDGLAHYILLATDGQPNCDTGTSGTTTAAAVTNTVAAITAAAAPGTDIKTYVIGIGPEAGNLTAFAQAGGTTDFFPASSPDALTQALTTIVGTVASCDFTMAEQPSDPTNLGVYLDNTTKVPRDSAEGYSLGADNVTVTLNGSYCAGLKDGTFKVVQVFFGCPGVPPPDNF